MLTAKQTPSVSGRTVPLALALGAAVLLMLVAAWYRIGVWRRFAGWTHMDGRVLELDVATRTYLMLVATNLALRIGSLDALGPFAEERHARFLLSRLHCR